MTTARAVSHLTVSAFRTRLAQSVERQALNLVVEGSSPSVGAIWGGSSNGRAIASHAIGSGIDARLLQPFLFFLLFLLHFDRLKRFFPVQFEPTNQRALLKELKDSTLLSYY